MMMRGAMKRERERGESSRQGASRGRTRSEIVEVAATPTPRASQTPHSSRMPTPGVTATAAERREIRVEYRELKTQINGRKTELAQADCGEFRAIVQKLDKVHSKVDKPREQITDAELLLDITGELLGVAKSAQKKDGISPAEFVGAVIHNYGLPDHLGNSDAEQILDFEAVGLAACAIMRKAPGLSTMVGPMDVELKMRKTAVRGRREKPTEKTRPQAVEEVDAEKPNSETDANMTTMFAILSQRQEVQLDHLVLNRVSFAQTIENLFALSFLVKDGRVQFKFSEDGTQLVVPCNAPAHQARADGIVKNSQFVFRLDFRCWRLMQDSVAEGNELMPNRQSGESPSTVQQRTARTPIRKTSRNRARETPAVAPPGYSPEEASRDGGSRLKRRIVLGSE